MRIKKLFSSPYLWVVVTTPLIPINVLFALGFWMTSKLTRKTAFPARCCVNVQLTYMLVFLIPLVVAELLSKTDPAVPEQRSFFIITLIALGLGLTSLAGILSLAFFNLRIFTENAFGRKVSPIPRIHFITE